jgi:AraC-like DNA-binding protein
MSQKLFLNYEVNGDHCMDKSQKRTGPPLLRMGHPMAFIAFLRHIGAPVDRYLRSQKLPVSCEDPDMFVPLARAWAFFETAAQHEDGMLGWLVGAHVGDHNLNRGLLRKLEKAPTLFQALQGLVRMANSEASNIQLGIQERRDDVVFSTHYSGKRDDPGYRISQAYQIGVILDLIRHFLGRHWVPDEIGIEHSIAPDVAEAQLPGSRILTQQPLGYIAMPRTCLHQTARRTVPTSAVAHDPVMTENFDYTDTLRAVLRSYLPDGYPNARFAAELMGVSERTLARRLSACGLTYGALIDEVRFAEAKKLLLKPEARIEDVAISIGFNDQTNFTRMFRRISGLTPREFRKSALC